MTGTDTVELLNNRKWYVLIKKDNRHNKTSGRVQNTLTYLNWQISYNTNQFLLKPSTYDLILL